MAENKSFRMVEERPALIAGSGIGYSLGRGASGDDSSINMRNPCGYN